MRQLAGDLQLNRNTVARAYKQLEDRGVILTAGRKGTFVRDDASSEVERIKSSRAERSVAPARRRVARRGLEPRRDRNPVQRRVARRDTEGNDAMSEWIDFAVYVTLIVLICVLLPRQSAQFTLPTIADRNPDVACRRIPMLTARIEQQPLVLEGLLCAGPPSASPSCLR